MTTLVFSGQSFLFPDCMAGYGYQTQWPALLLAAASDFAVNTAAASASASAAAASQSAAATSAAAAATSYTGTVAASTGLSSSGGARVARLGDLGSAAFVDWAALAPSYQYAAPTAGSTVTAAPVGASHSIIMEPSGTLATLTIAIPAAARDGQVLKLASSASVTALTISGGTLVPTISALTANVPARLQYVAQTGKWYII